MQISLPSTITFFPIARLLCTSTIFSLTGIIEEICETIEVTSFVLISLLTSSPFNKTMSLSPVLSILISMSFAIFIIFSSSFKSTFSFNVCNATHLYVAPVSKFKKPNSFSILFVTVPFPLPAGPSTATIILYNLHYFYLLYQNIYFCQLFLYLF